MKVLVTLGLFVFVHRIIYIRRDLTEDSGRLKITNLKILFVSNNYIKGDTCHVTLKEESANRNRLEVDCEIVQDLPSDTKLDVRVFRSADKNGPWKSIANYASHICDKTDSYYKYHEYWSDFLKKQTEGGKCIEKGKILTKDAGVFKFWNLLPKNETEGYYFMSKNALRTSEIIIVISEIYYEPI